MLNENNVKIQLLFGNDVDVSFLEDIKDNATYKDPHKYSEGMKYVFVNGKLSVEGGQKISGRYGRVIRSLTE